MERFESNTSSAWSVILVACCLGGLPARHIAQMGSWGFFDWVGYVTLFVAAIVMAWNGALSAAPKVRRAVPWFLKKHWYAYVPLSLMVISLVGFVASAAMPKADYENKLIITRYGTAPGTIVIPGNPIRLEGTKSCFIDLNPDSILSLSKDYDLVGVCFHYSGTEDILDTKDISRSGHHDIVKGPTSITAPWSDKFISELMQGRTGTNYFLLAVPKNLRDFDTLRQATTSGAIILNARSGPP